MLQNQSQIVYKRYSDAYTSPCIIYVNNNFCLIRTILQITWQLFLIFLHCRINTIYVHCRKISNPFTLAAKQDRKNRQRLTFLPVSKARTNYFYIFQQCTYIVYISVQGRIPLILEKKWFFGDFSHEIPQTFSRLSPLGAIFLSASLLTWNPGSDPAVHQ